MNVREAFDDWATTGRDLGMERRHWHTAKHALARMPVESGEAVVDLGTGSGYALRALRERGIGRGYGLDGAPEMVKNARQFTVDPNVGYVIGDFGDLPFSDNAVDHVFSMEAIYYATDLRQTLGEVRRILRPGGTFYCAVNFYEESESTHDWQAQIPVEMTLWDRHTYRTAFRESGLLVAEQDTIPDREIEIPPDTAFPTDDWETRDQMRDRYRTWGTLLTVGVAP